MKILVVDDASIMRKVIIRELIELGIEEGNVFQAEDGSEAVKMAAESEFDLILMDWNMPNKLGIDAIKEIRASGNKTPICMVTTESEKQNVILAIQSGANNYLTKPFSKEDFHAKVGTMLK